MPERVGVRELRQNLSKHLVRVKAGESLIVTERGDVVARVVPDGDGVTEADRRLAEKYGATIPRRDRTFTQILEEIRAAGYPPVPEGTLERFLAEDRRDRFDAG